MCNQEEKCKMMRNAALRVLIEHLKMERKNKAFNKCRNIIAEIKTEISEYECEPFIMIKKKIKEYQACEYLTKRIRMIDVLLAELQAFLED